MPQLNSSNLTEDRACIHCGYNLRGLSAEGLCPECGKPIANSLRENLLEYADPEWLEKLRFGCVLKLWHIAALGIVVVGTVCVAALGLPRFAHIALQLVRLAASALAVWASFTITIVEPRIAGKEGSITWRKVIRWCAVVGFSGLLADRAVAGRSWFADVAFILRCAWFVAVCGELVYLRRLALYAADTERADDTWKVFRGALVVVIGSFLVSAVRQSVGLGIPRTPAPVPVPAYLELAGTFLNTFNGLLGLYAIIIFVRYIGLLNRFRAMFAAAESRSRELATQPDEELTT